MRKPPELVLQMACLLCTLISLGLVIALFIGLTLVLGQPQRLEMWLLLWILAVSIAAFLVYGFDKSQSERGSRRVPEEILHLFSLLGGSPGAFVAMQALPHKTNDQDFQLAFWLIVAAQVAVLACVALR